MEKKTLEKPKKAGEQVEATPVVRDFSILSAAERQAQVGKGISPIRVLPG